MSGRSARHYMTDAQLIEDARYWRGVENEYLRRAHTEWNASDSLREAHAAKMRADASESFLRRRRLDAEQIERAIG